MFFCWGAILDLKSKVVTPCGGSSIRLYPLIPTREADRPPKEAVLVGDSTGNKPLTDARG
jgi:hypothetical protein